MYTQPSTHYPPRQKSVVLYADLQELYQKSHKKNKQADTERIAQVIGLMARMKSANTDVCAIVDEEDHKARAVFQRNGIATHSWNGERQEAMRQLIYKASNQQPPDELTVISDDPNFGVLCVNAAHGNADVEIWSLEQPPQELIDSRFTNRQISELLGDPVNVNTVGVWLDLENVLLSLHNSGVEVDTQELLQVLQQLLKDLGNLYAMRAFADFSMLQEVFGRDVQRELEREGIETRYQINLNGKNSADMALSSDIHTTIEREPSIRDVVIVSGDRDLHPTAKAARERGKRVTIVAMERSLSEQLRKVADEVRLLDDAFRAKGPDPSHGNPEHPATPLLLQIAYRLHENRWRWVYKDRIADIAGEEEIEEMLKKGFLSPGRPGCSVSVSLNPANPLAQKARTFGWWAPARVQYLIQKKEMDYVDTSFLARGMQMDRQCQQLGIGQTWSDAKSWLDAAVIAGLIEMRSQTHPKDEKKVIYTWWPQNQAPTESITTQHEDDEESGSDESNQQTFV